MRASVHSIIRQWLPRLPVIVAVVALLFIGLFLLQRSDAQARDTIRKHHLEDIEQSLYYARSLHGTYPPYDQPTWCGQLDEAQSSDVRAQIEEVLRAQNEKYSNPAKPFPIDPLADQLPSAAPREASERSGEAVGSTRSPHYFYWKRSPALFELYAILEAAPTGERNTIACPTASPLYYDYGIASHEREDRISIQP